MSRMVYLPPGPIPQESPSALQSSAVAVTGLSSEIPERSAVRASRTLMVDAGRYRPCGSLAAITAPLSRSATSQAADVSRSGTRPADESATTPHPPSASPPTGGECTGSGDGVVEPGATTSDSSTAGGGETRCGQWSVSGDASCGCACVGAAHAGDAVGPIPTTVTIPATATISTTMQRVTKSVAGATARGGRISHRRLQRLTSHR